jgi:uncharacterized protein (TIGR00251 family)
VSALPKFLTETKGGLLVKLKVQPRSSRNKLGDLDGDEWRIWVTAPPVDAAANQAVLELLADELKLSKSQVQLVRGDTARHKVVRITGLTGAELVKRAGGLL